MARRYWWIIVLLLLVALGAGWLWKGYSSQNVYIGYVGGLTGKFSDIGVSGRNGVMLAVEEINRQGGIRGKKLELLVKDDQNDAEQAMTADRELIRSGAWAIIGHMTSAMSAAGVPVINREGVVMVSPTTRATMLSEKDDMFFTLMPPVMEGVKAQVRYAQEKGLRSFCILFDRNNRQFAGDWAEGFNREFSGVGGTVLAVEEFSSASERDYKVIAETLLKKYPDGILMAVSAIDGAMLCQQLRIYNPNVVIMSSSWGMTDEFISNAGIFSEGVIFSNPVDPDDDYPAYKSFQQRYHQRYGINPDFAAAYGYEAAKVLEAVLEKEGDPRKLKEALLTQSSYSGLWGNFSFTPQGDAIRPNYIFRVEGGHFKKVK